LTPALPDCRHGCFGTSEGGAEPMDVISIVIAVVFFAAMLALIAGLERV
jgi:anaerobic C4-dicarboxylate transporter